MNFRLLLCLLLVLTGTNYGFACDCYERNYAQAKLKDYNKAGVIFIGDALKASASGIVTKVIEALKGDLPDSVIVEENSCTSPMHAGERWLVYAIKKADNVYSIMPCSLSRSFSNPFIVVAKDGALTFPAPGTKSPSKNELKLSRELQLAESKIKLYDEIDELRKKRHDQSSQKLDQYKILSIVLSGLLVISVLILVFRKPAKQLVN
ncbi:hypothetical protein IM792_10310 [Mucilaginibacter sp. JRF]|uniref:hypothetical protein n=1 Tax=Mucilaginibacter sp. JRF TaxID=2780088 RepID=UPI00188081DB|nr:hypothetical protein [Mucilaginibacter sp. JRF]MBE9584840.1 hypothetical protein [Mucilaginibacter sp. JRF]